MAIQIHQLNEISTPAMTDYLADDTGTDTGKISIETLAGAILADYQATFGEDTTDVVSKISDLSSQMADVLAQQAVDASNITALQTSLDEKVSKAGDTMTGNLVVSGDAVQRLIRINNGVRNLRWTVNQDGNAGFYDDGESKWLMRFGSNGSLTIVVGGYSYTFNSSGVLATYNGTTLVGAFPNVRVGTYVYNGTSTQTFTFTPSGTPAATNYNRIIAMAQDAGNISNASLNTSTGVVTIRTVSAVTVCRVNYLLFHD